MNEYDESYELDTKRKLMIWIWGRLPAVALLILILIIIGLFGQINSKSERIKAERLASMKMERPSVNVVVLEVAPRVIRDKIELPGMVEPKVELKILAEVRGKVDRVAVDEGDFVKKGDIIARIDKRDYENALASVSASYELADRNLDRIKELHSKDLVSKSELDRAQSEAARLEAAFKTAELNLQRSVIKAPFNGTINQLDAKKGLLLNVGEPVAIILDISSVKVSVGIPESDVDAVRKLKEFNVTIDALGGKTLKGRKVFLSKSPDSRARLYELQLSVDNPGEEILPGMFARVNIVKEEVTDGVSVPLYAVVTRDEKSFVFVENNGTAHVRMVEMGIVEGWLIQITKGLEPGERVVVVGQRSLDEGQGVNVARTVSDPEELFK
jgi:RND family efflux transporter MFP subunit